MALKIPVSSPLTESQGELTSKIGSMKSLLSLPIDINLTIPKDKQISLFDYLLKIFRVLGLNPELMFNLFLDKVFDQAGTFLEEKVLDAVADSIGQKGRELPNTINPNATQAEKEDFKKSNREYLKNLVPPTFLQAVKQQIAKDLTLMVFGPRNGPEAEALNPSASERSRLIDDAVCGENLFNLSSDPIVKQEDVEFNRVSLKKKLEAGEVIFEISCQDVKIKLPEDPGFIFEGGGTFTQSTTTVTPAQSLNLLVQYVKDQTQNINNEQNANSAGSSFFEILIGKLLNYISSLVFPWLGPIFTAISSDPAANGLDPSNVAYSNCDIANAGENPSQNPSEKQEFLRSLANALLKELLRMLLVFAIKEFKKLVTNYFARTAIEKQKRRAEKLKLKFEIFRKIGGAAQKAAKFAEAAKTLTSVLGQIE